MKMQIDGELCSGHGRCAILAAEVYGLDDIGYNASRGGIIDVAPGMEDKALLGMKSCPEFAISVADE